MKKIYIIGDSTAACKQESERPEYGWGEMLPEFIPSEVKVVNLAKNGASSKSFRSLPEYKKLVSNLSEGDLLLIQFGHNDQKTDDRGTKADGDYKVNLQHYIELAKEKHAYPVLLTSVTRRAFNNHKFNIYSLGDYPQAVRELSQKLSVPMIDLNKETISLYKKLGEEVSKNFHLFLGKDEYDNFPDGREDNTHFSKLGAKMVANLICRVDNEHNIIKEWYKDKGVE